MGTLIETIDDLLELADPERLNYGKLMELRNKVVAGTMLGPKSLRYIEKLVQRKDNVECRHLLGRGSECRVPGIKVCRHREWFRGCSQFLPVNGTTRENPLAA